MKKGKLIQIQIISMILMLVQFMVFPVYAETSGNVTSAATGGGGDVDLGGEGDGTNGDYVGGQGFSALDGGYRIYLESDGGVIQGPVIDLYFEINGHSPPFDENNIRKLKQTAIGNGTTSLYVSYQTVEQNLPGLKPPIYNHQPFGQELNKWFETNNTVNAQLTNAEAFIGSVYLAAGVNASQVANYIQNYQLGHYRIVVEAVYWFGYLLKEVSVPYDLGDGQLYFYGTVKDLAEYESNLIEDVKQKLGINPNYNDGTWWFGIYTNAMCSTALTLVQDDTFSGMKVIQEQQNSRGRYQYSQILKQDQSFGVHVILREQASEKWATYDATKYGGTKGLSPGRTPEMPPVAGLGEDTWRDVTVIKYYEQAVRDQNGKISYVTAAGPYKQTQICVTIDVQNEPGWTLKEFFQSKVDRQWPLYQNITEMEKSNGYKYNQATQVQVDIERGYKYLILWFVKDADPIEVQPQETDLEMKLTESEISKGYITNQIKDNTQPKLQFTWQNPHIATNEYCYSIQVPHEYTTGEWKYGVTGKDKDGKPVEGWYYDEETYTEMVTENHTHNYEWQDSELVLKTKLDDQRFNEVKQILGTTDPFRPILNTQDGTYTKTVDAKQTEEAALENFSAKFTVWRGEDQPTIASYKAQPGDSQAVDNLLDATQASKVDNGKRKNSADVASNANQYQQNLTLYFKVDESGNYQLSSACQNQRDDCAYGRKSDTVDILSTNGQNVYTFKGPVTVDYFNGSPNSPVTQIKQSADIIRRYPEYQNVQFYPYVQMSYQTAEQAGTNEGGIVYVLGSYQREFKAAAALKLNWKENYYPGTKYSMLVRSDQWQTHATALDRYGKNILLPGGAIYQVTTNPGGGQSTLGGTLTLEAWYPDIITDYAEGIVQKPDDWNGNNGYDEFAALVNSAKTNIENNARLEFKVVNGQKQSAYSGTLITGGVDLQTIGHSGLKASTDSKYLLESDDLSAANSRRAKVTASGVQKTEINVVADPATGVVNISGVGSNVSIAKDKGADSISSTSAAKKADDYTSLIQNFVQQLQRNAGNDTETTFGKYWADKDGHWYNEAFGFKINYYKATISIGVPANDNINDGGVTAVLDPNLGPTYYGTSSKFDNVNTGQFFMMLNNRTLGKFGDATVNFPGTSGGYLLSSQPFYIASYTVQDND